MGKVENWKEAVAITLMMAFAAAAVAVPSVSANTYGNTSSLHRYIANIYGWQIASCEMKWTFEVDSNGYFVFGDNTFESNYPHVADWSGGSAVINGDQTATSTTSLKETCTFTLGDAFGDTQSETDYNWVCRTDGSHYIIYYGCISSYSASSQIPLQVAFSISFAL